MPGVQKEAQAWCREPGGLSPESEEDPDVCIRKKAGPRWPRSQKPEEAAGPDSRLALWPSSYLSTAMFYIHEHMALSPLVPASHHRPGQSTGPDVPACNSGLSLEPPVQAPRVVSVPLPPDLQSEPCVGRIRVSQTARLVAQLLPVANNLRTELTECRLFSRSPLTTANWHLSASPQGSSSWSSNLSWGSKVILIHFWCEPSFKVRTCSETNYKDFLWLIKIMSSPEQESGFKTIIVGRNNLISLVVKEMFSEIISVLW